MKGFNFTERVRRVLAAARELAEGMESDSVGTEHVLLALLAEGEGVAGAVLADLGASPAPLAARVRERAGSSRSDGHKGPDLPYTARAKKVLELAIDEARELGHDYVGTEHLLLGVLREGHGVAAQVLEESGLSVEATRAATLRILGSARGGAERRVYRLTGDLGRELPVIVVTVRVDCVGDAYFEEQFATPEQASAYLRALVEWRRRRSEPPPPEAAT